jgi:RNA polymerase-binding transcription factor DksA
MAETDHVRADVQRLDAIGRELGDVDVALRRLEDGTYDTCEVCGARIDDGVLVDAPLTRRCRGCDPGPGSERPVAVLA